MTSTNEGTPVLLLTPKETSVVLGRSLDELRSWRRQNTGPTYHSLGNRLIRYSAAAVHEYAASHQARLDPPER